MFNYGKDWQSVVDNESSVLAVLSQMASLNLKANIETVSRVLPLLEVADDPVDSLFSKLLSANVSPSVAAGSLLIRTLQCNDFRAATQKASLYK